MVNPYIKDIWREIRRAPGRILSLVLITALGVAIYVGVQYTPIDMRHTAERFYHAQRLQDIHMLSVFGFDDADLAKIQSIDGLTVSPSYARDVFVYAQDRGYVAHVMSLPSEGSVNAPFLLDGRMPERDDECLVDPDFYSLMGEDFGNTLTLTAPDGENLSEHLSVTQFTIVGTAQDPRYISGERGSSALGNGQVSFYVLLPEGAFVDDIYSELNVTVTDAFKMDPYSQKYKDLVAEVKHTLEDVGEEQAPERYTDILRKAEAELSDARTKLENGRRERDEKLADAALKITDAEAEIAEGERELAKGRQTLATETADAQTKINDGWAELTLNQSRLDDSLRQLNSSLPQLDNSKSDLDASLERLNTGKTSLDSLEASVKGLYEQASVLPDGSAEKSAMLAQADSLYKQLETESAVWSAAWAQYETGLTQWTAEYERVQRGLSDIQAGQRELDEAGTELRRAEDELRTRIADSEYELSKAEQELSDGREKIATAREDYETGAQESAQELASAEAEITEAEEQLTDLPAPKWYVFDRDQLPGFSGYEDDTGNIKAIAAVFPLIFFLVAALVCLTSMTRMVEEHRMQIGTYKALGYGKASIEWKYIVYALLSSSLGSLGGIALGRRLLPWLISNAYGIVYDLPPLEFSLDAGYSVVAIAAGVGSIVGATLLSCLNETRSSAASLLRPKPPKNGKRILLERVTFLWRRMSFISKVTARNLFRYKKRFLMTVLGIAGCTALLVTGFGLRDSITDIAVRQFEVLSHYGLQINYAGSDAEQDQLYRLLDASPSVSAYIRTQHRQLEASSDGKPSDVNLIVVGDTAATEDYLVLRDRKTKEPVPWSDTGALISEKLGYTLGIGPGDTITLTNEDHESYDIPISGVVEHYVHHYVYMTDTLYADVFGEDASPNNIFALLNDMDDGTEDALSEELMRLDSVNGLMFTTNLVKNVDNMIKSMDFVIYVLLVSAAGLAFIVLFNLTNINITERVRELATIRVLGFTDGELAMYMYRENVWLTLIGILAGLVGGYYLHRFVIVTAEVDLVMFCREIHLASYLGSVALTVLFSVLVNLVMYPKLVRINMIESLKSVE